MITKSERRGGLKWSFLSVGVGGWGEGGVAVGGGCVCALLIRNGGKMCSLTNNCVAHNL